MYRHRIAEITEIIVIEVQVYREYIKNSESEAMNVFERENIQLTRQYLTRQDLT